MSDKTPRKAWIFAAMMLLIAAPIAVYTFLEAQQHHGESYATNRYVVTYMQQPAYSCYRWKEAYRCYEESGEEWWKQPWGYGWASCLAAVIYSIFAFLTLKAIRNQAYSAKAQVELFERQLNDARRSAEGQMQITRGQLEATRIAANAALAALDRPWLLFEMVSENFRSVHMKETSITICKFRFKNYGNDLAFITDCRANIGLWADRDAMYHAHFSGRSNMLENEVEVINSVIGKGETTVILQVKHHVVTDEIWGLTFHPRNGTVPAFFGVISYTDMNNRPHETWFCYRIIYEKLVIDWYPGSNKRT